MEKENSRVVEVDELLARMADAARTTDLDGLRDAVTAAYNANLIHDLARRSEFWERLESVTVHLDSHSDEQTVLSLAQIGRLHKSLSYKRQSTAELAARILSKGAPSSFRYGDSKQREFAVVAALASGQRFEPNQLAAAVVEEDKSDKIRDMWMEALLDKLPLSDVFACLAQEVAADGYRSDRNRPARLQRILKALNARIHEADIPDDESLPAGFRRFVTNGFANVARPNDHPAPALAVEELTRTALQIVRFRIRLSADASLYSSVALARSWLPDGGWTLMTATSGGLKQLRRTLLDALLLLLEQDKPDTDLLDAHRSLCPNTAFAHKELKKAETAALNVAPELRQWLASGGAKTRVAKTAELDETDDLSIAMAMIVANDLRERTDASASSMIGDLRFKAPIHVDTLTGIVDLTKQLTDRIDFLATRRQLRLFGSPGEVVEFKSHAYRLSENSEFARHVQVQSPGVEKLGRTASRVIVPALVKACQG